MLCERKLSCPSPLTCRNFIPSSLSLYLSKLHKENKPSETISLFDNKRHTQSQQFVQIYENLKSQGALDDQRIYETALDLLAEQRRQSRSDVAEEQLVIEASDAEVAEETKQKSTTLLNEFQEAGEQTKSAPSKAKKDPTPGVNIDSLFKD